MGTLGERFAGGCGEEPGRDPGGEPGSRFLWVPECQHYGLPFQMLVDSCSSAPCQNGGRCARAGTSFHCLCPPGWSGSLCDIQSLPCREAAAQMGEGEHVARVQIGRVHVHILPVTVSPMRVRRSICAGGGIWLSMCRCVTVTVSQDGACVCPQG